MRPHEDMVIEATKPALKDCKFAFTNHGLTVVINPDACITVFQQLLYK
jgi:NAD-dependent dihydropyrimidine dehydrogenase PreA subunit